MKKSYGLLALLFCGAVSFGAYAQDVTEVGGDAAPADEGSGSSGGSDTGSSDRRLYVSPMGSFTWADKDRNTGNGIGGVIAVGKRMTSGLDLELTGYYSRHDTGFADQTAKMSGVGAAALVFPSHSLPDLYAKVAVHKGQAKDHPSTPNSKNFTYETTVSDFGVGYLLPLGRWLGGYDMSLRAEALYRYDAHTRPEAGKGGKKDFYEGVFNVGVLIPLGKLPVQATEAPVEVVQAAPSDTDGDGIPDDQDQCPDTAAGVTVNEKGCEGDADGDGVVDRLDNCPDTAAGTAVNEQGCAVVKDADGDGIPDDKDQCPDTAAGATVDDTGCAPKPTGCRAPAPGEPINLEGCATGEAVVLKGVNFEVNSARLTANAKVILNQVGDALSANPSMKAEIGGHTDSTGPAKLNERLSQKRAQAVKDYLVKRGIAADRLTVKGYGPTQPIDTNETPEGRELNRRVELKVLQGGQ